MTRIRNSLLDERLVIRDELSSSSSSSLVSIKIEQLPTKMQYCTGETLDLTGIVVKGIFTAGFYQYADITEDNVTGYDPNRNDTQTLTVTIQGKSATFEVTVKPELSITINSGSDSKFILPLKYGSGTAKHALTIDWGDGNIQTVTGLAGITAQYQGLTHNYSSKNTQYTIRLSGSTYLTTAENNGYYGLGFYSGTTGVYNETANKRKVIAAFGSPDILLSDSMPSKDYCYQYMFSDCTNLINAPVLPATTLASYCYQYMFYSCSKLITAPELPATNLATQCYNDMFNGCTSLTNAPALPATTLATYCYQYMFYRCTSLINAPELPATTLTSSCYYSMFYNCTNLITAPELPATNLATQCYNNMFYGCTSLTNAPALPATTLATYCYQAMLAGCTSLINAPELPATTLSYNCYYSMFYNCTSLDNKTITIATAPSDISWVSNMFSLKTSSPNATLYLDTDQSTFDTYNVSSVKGNYTDLIKYVS
jgi:hypothetical protein